MGHELATALFKPRGIALVGVSSDPSRPNGRPLYYLRKHGYPGAIYPVNPRHARIAGLRCYPRLHDVGEPIDQAFIMVSDKDAIFSAVRACGESDITCATILAGGFAEAGIQGKADQDRLLAIARQSGVRILGPNSIGLINPRHGLAMSANAVLDLPELKAGGTAVISQSGSIVGAILSRGHCRNTGFSKLVSVGNELDLSVGEIGNLLLEDDETEVILLFLETLRDRNLVVEFSEKAARTGKPVIGYHVGRSDIGSRIAQSHTGALATSEKLFNAFLDDHGIARVRMLESFTESPRVFTGRRPNDHDREGGVAVVTTTGSGGTMVIDSLAECGIPVLPPPASTVARLRRFGVTQPPHYMIDLTMAGARPEIVTGLIDDLLGSEDVLAVIMVVGSSAQFHPELAVKPLVTFARHKKPLLVFITPEADSSLRLLTLAGIPAFRTPDACAEAVRALLSWKTPRSSDRYERLRRLKSLPVCDGVLPQSDALAFIKGLNIEVAVHALATASAEASRLATQIGFPVALKIASSDILHKSDLSGVRLNIPDAEAVAREFDSLVQNFHTLAPGACWQGVIVQEMIQGSAEAIVGYHRDPVTGPMIMLGVGGVMAEIYDDSVFAVAPVTPEIACRMVDRVKGLATVTGYRSHPKGDVEALVRAIVALSHLAAYNSVAEAEINPLIVRREGEGVIAVDGLVIGTSRNT